MMYKITREILDLLAFESADLSRDHHFWEWPPLPFNDLRALLVEMSDGGGYVDVLHGVTDG